MVTTSAELRAFVQRDPEDRRLILLRHWDDRVIAERFAITEEAAKKRYERALPRLARLVQGIQRGDLDGAGPA